MRVDVILNEYCTPRQVAELAELAERHGFRTLWSASYANFRDPFMVLVKAAETTRTIRLGTIAISPYELHPVKMAQALFTLNEMSNGRASLVVGGGGGVIQSLGLTPENRVGHVRECVDILKGASPGKPLTYSGRYYRANFYRPTFATQARPEITVGASKPKMLNMATEKADGLMMSDIMPELLKENMPVIRDGLKSNGRDRDPFIVNNFWAWHLKEERKDSVREARIELIYRGWLVRRYLEPFLAPEEVELVLRNKQKFLIAYVKQSPVIDGVPDAVIDKLLDAFTSTGSYREVDREIERFRTMAGMGMTDIALRVHENPAQSIRFIGERVIPALKE